MSTRRSRSIPLGTATGTGIVLVSGFTTGRAS